MHTDVQHNKLKSLFVFIKLFVLIVDGGHAYTGLVISPPVLIMLLVFSSLQNFLLHYWYLLHVLQNHALGDITSHVRVVLSNGIFKNKTLIGIKHRWCTSFPIGYRTTFSDRISVGRSKCVLFSFMLSTARSISCREWLRCVLFLFECAANQVSQVCTELTPNHSLKSTKRVQANTKKMGSTTNLKKI